MLQKTSLLALLCLLLTQAIAQDVQKIEKSIYIEYGYEGIDTDDVVGQMMFAKKRLAIYADADFMMLQTYSTDPKPQTMEAIVVGMIKDMKTGKVYPCLTIGDQKLRQKETLEQSMSEDIFSGLSDSDYEMSKTDNAEKIAGIASAQWNMILPEMEDTSSVYLSLNISPNDAIKDQPLFVFRSDEYLGLLLGKDSAFGPKIYQFRALKVELDRPRPIAEQLATFEETSEEMLNKTLKSYLGF